MTAESVWSPLSTLHHVLVWKLGVKSVSNVETWLMPSSALEAANVRQNLGRNNDDNGIQRNKMIGYSMRPEI